MLAQCSIKGSVVILGPLPPRPRCKRTGKELPGRRLAEGCLQGTVNKFPEEWSTTLAPARNALLRVDHLHTRKLGVKRYNLMKTQWPLLSEVSKNFCCICELHQECMDGRGREQDVVRGRRVNLHLEVERNLESVV